MGRGGQSPGRRGAERHDGIVAAIGETGQGRDEQQHVSHQRGMHSNPDEQRAAPFAMLVRPASCDAATGAVVLGAAARRAADAAARPTVLIKRALARATFVRLAACGRDLQPLSILFCVVVLLAKKGKKGG